MAQVTGPLLSAVCQYARTACMRLPEVLEAGVHYIGVPQ